ncbi:DotU family type IV/VI secretion system protein [Glaciimonas sp. GG7]
MIFSHSSHSLRSLLLDTALQITLLPQHFETISHYKWRARCASLIEQLRNKMGEADYDQAIINEVIYAQCALLDDTVQHYLSEVQRCEWKNKSLEMHFFNSNKAGNIIFKRIEMLLQQAAPLPERIALYDTVLGLGFGRYCSEASDAERQRLITRLVRCADRQIKHSYTSKAKALTKQSPVFPMSRLHLTALGLVFSLLLWCALNQQLESNTNRLFESLSMMVVISSVKKKD